MSSIETKLREALQELLDASPTSCEDARLNEAQRKAEKLLADLVAWAKGRPIVHYANPCEREDCRATREELDELCAAVLALNPVLVEQGREGASTSLASDNN